MCLIPQQENQGRALKITQISITTKRNSRITALFTCTRLREVVRRFSDGMHGRHVAKRRVILFPPPFPCRDSQTSPPIQRGYAGREKDLDLNVHQDGNWEEAGKRYRKDVPEEGCHIRELHPDAKNHNPRRRTG